MEIQRRLFEEIKKKLQSNHRLADVIGDFLDISSDSTYRRIRGEKELSMSELEKLCVKFKISVDSLFNHRSDSISFKYTPLNFSSPQVYENYMEEIARLYGSLVKQEHKEFKITAQDIPVFHFLPYIELTFFKVYALYRSLTNETISYEAFVKNFDTEKLRTYYKSITDAFLQIPSTEIWSNHTVEPIINLLSYYYDLSCFESQEMAVLLGKQLLRLIKDVEEKTQTSSKTYKGQVTSYNFHVSPVDMQNDFILTKGLQSTTTSIKLFTINAIFTADEAFNEETEKWFDNTKSKSIQISGTSERERFHFFKEIKSKVQELIQKFE